MATLIVPWYRPHSDRHASELLCALIGSLRAPGLERLLLVSESEPPPLFDPRLEFVRTPARASWWDLFELVRDEGPFAICNADCAVVDLRHVALLLPHECLWISRWEPDGNSRYRCALYGADLFAFAAVPDRIEGHPGMPGEYGGDTRLGQALEAAGYRVRNLPCAVPIIHYHAERSPLDELSRPGLGQPCGYHCEPAGDYPSPLWREALTRPEQRVQPMLYPEPLAPG